MLTKGTLPANATFGLLKIVWNNGTSDLPPAGINFGTGVGPANPGIESLPQLNSTSAVNTWQFTHAQGVAPLGTTKVSFFALFVDQSAGTGYFDDLAATQVPEPSSLALYRHCVGGGPGETFPSTACAIGHCSRALKYRIVWENEATMPLVRLPRPSASGAHLICCLLSGARGRGSQFLLKDQTRPWQDATCKSGKSTR